MSISNEFGGLMRHLGSRMTFKRVRWILVIARKSHFVGPLGSDLIRLGVEMDPELQTHRFDP